MSRAPQKRRLETRAKLLSAAETIVAEHGVSALRMEDVVAQAGVAKGTLFSHFGDKDGLLTVILGARIMVFLDEMEAGGCPQSIGALAERLTPALEYVASDRMIFDLLLRYSGTTGADANEMVTQGFIRQTTLLTGWLEELQNHDLIRKDMSPALLAEGIQAFTNHVIAIGFCMEHTGTPPGEAIKPYLEGWLSMGA